LLAGIRLACAKRSLPTGSIEKVVDDIEIGLQQLGRAEVSTKLIGEIAVNRIKELDRVAYIRFASIYKDFADIESFREEVEALLSARGNTKGEPQEQLTLIPIDTIQSSQPRRRGRRLGQVSGPRHFVGGD
jgi:transcriptional repressor NrdR